VALGAALLAIGIWRLAWPALLDEGTALRARHRWAAIEASFDGRTRLLLWKPAPPFAAISPIEGAPNGLHLGAGGAGLSRARVRLGGGPVPAGRYTIAVNVTDEGPTPAHFTLAGAAIDLAPGGHGSLVTVVTQRAGFLDLDAQLNGGRVWIDGARVQIERRPGS